MLIVAPGVSDSVALLLVVVSFDKRETTSLCFCHAKEATMQMLKHARERNQILTESSDGNSDASRCTQQLIGSLVPEPLADFVKIWAG